MSYKKLLLQKPTQTVKPAAATWAVGWWSLILIPELRVFFSIGILVFWNLEQSLFTR